MTIEPSGGPTLPSALSSDSHSVPLRRLARCWRLARQRQLVRVVREQLVAGRVRLLVAFFRRLVVRPEQVVAIGRRVVLAVGLFGGQALVGVRRDVRLLGLRLSLRRALGGGVQAVDASLRVRVAGTGHAARADDVRLPVVELELSRRAHLLLGALRVLNVRQADRDLVLARALDLGLGDAERVRPLADRLDGVVDRLRRDLGHLGRRAALVDELDAALEVQPEPRLLLQGAARNDQERRQRQQPGDCGEDREVSSATGHLGVSTTRSPPSSS